MKTLRTHAMRDGVFATKDDDEHEIHGETVGANRAAIRVIALVHQQTRSLVDVVNAHRCEQAWVMKLELLQSLSFAASVVDRIPEANRSNLMRRLNAIKWIAMNALNAAPTLSERAASQIRDTPGATLAHLPSAERQARRSDWYAEEERWIAERTLAGPLPPVEIP